MFVSSIHKLYSLIVLFSPIMSLLPAAGKQVDEEG